MEEISIRILFNILKKSAILIIALGIIGMVIAFSLTEYVFEDKYEAKIRLYAFTDWGENPSQEANALQFLQSVINSYIQILRSNTFCYRVIQDTQISLSPAQLKDMISFTILNETEIFEVRIVAGSPEHSILIADSVAKMAPEMINSIYNRPAISVLDWPELPTRPFFPNLELNIVIGFLCGAFIAAAYAVINSIAKDALRDEDEFTKKFAIPVLGVIPPR